MGFTKGTYKNVHEMTRSTRSADGVIASLLRPLGKGSW